VIFVTTAGKVGSAAARLIAQRDVPVRVLVRHLEKVAEKVAPLAQAEVEIFPGDLDSPESIDQAMRGVSTVILVTQPVLSQELSVIDSAERAASSTSSRSPTRPTRTRRSPAAASRARSRTAWSPQDSPIPFCATTPTCRTF
jgi:uncharacterized protein YbjT (DUF2867 family)